MIHIPVLQLARNEFPAVDRALADPDGLLCAGGDLSVSRLLRAYRLGIFPWFNPGELILWWSPNPRCVFMLNTIKLPRRLAQFARQSRWKLSADTAFESVIDACAAPRNYTNATWIGAEMRSAYLELHRLGHAHSIEVWDQSRLVGGIYGVAIGRVFFGESMFSTASGGSKIALFALARQLEKWKFPLMDGQVRNSHLISLGAELIPRKQFTGLLDQYCVQDALTGLWDKHFEISSASELVAQHWPG